MIEKIRAIADWSVLGGGPMGIFAVATMLKEAPSTTRINWIDPSFTVGRLLEYKSIPGNTAVSKLHTAFSLLNGFDAAQQRRALHAESGDASQLDCVQGRATLAECDPSLTCGLNLCVDALADATAALLLHPRVTAIPGTVSALRGAPDSGWTASLYGGDASGGANAAVRSRRALLCTGATPRPPPDAALDLLRQSEVYVAAHDSVVAPAKLAALGDSEITLAGSRWAIVGASHSGMLAAQNLHEAGAAAVTVLSRSPLVFATQRSDLSGIPPWVQYDGTGIKGTVAAWAKSLPPSVTFKLIDSAMSDVEIAAEAAAAATATTVASQKSDQKSTPSSNRSAVAAAVAYCIGFDRVAPRDITWSSAADSSHTRSSSDVDLDSFVNRSGHVPDAPGLYGLGLGFPDEWTDPEGRTETRVGFHFTVRHMRRILAHAQKEL